MKRPPKIALSPFMIAKLNLQPGDRIVLQTDLILSKDQVDLLRERANEQFRPYKTIILVGGMKIGVLRKRKKR